MASNLICLATLALWCAAAIAPAQTPPSFQIELPDGMLDYGIDYLKIPPGIPQNANSPRTVQLLGEQVRREAGLNKAKLLMEIGQCKMKEGTPFVQEAMSDGEGGVRAQASLAAGLIRDPVLRAGLEQLTKDADAAVRREALIALCEMDKETSQESPAIAAGLADTDPQVQIAAFRRCSTEKSAQTIAGLLPKLSGLTQIEAIRGLGRTKATSQASAVLPFLKGSVIERAAAVEALGQIKATAQLAEVERLLADPHATVRRAAVAALEGVADATMLQKHSIRILGDADPSVAEAAVTNLSRHPTIDGVAGMYKLLDVPYRPLHAALRIALTQYDSPNTKQATIDAAAVLLEHSNPRRREDASFILGALKSDAALEKHLLLIAIPTGEASKNVDWTVVEQAALSLGVIGNKQAGPAIAKLAGNKDVRSYIATSRAAVAAGRLGEKSAIPAITEIANGNPMYQPAELRASAMWALGALVDPTDNSVHGRFLATLTNMYEGDQTKFEACKSLGNRRAKSAARTMGDQGNTNSSPMLRWIGHWAHDRITGTTTPYTPPPAPWQAVTSITDLPATGD